MLTVHQAARRGHLDHGWLDTWHTFSFGDFFVPERMGFRALRVINEDVIAPGSGFPLHPHRDMEILTWPISGELTHEDSMGNRGVLRPGRLQRMSAGTGIRHAERNASPDTPVHLLQIWVLPDETGHAPSYEDRDVVVPVDTLGLVASGDPDDGTTTWHRDARLFAARCGAGRSLTHEPAPGRHAWLQMISGAVDVGDVPLVAGDGLAVSGESRLEIAVRRDCDFLLFDLD